MSEPLEVLSWTNAWKGLPDPYFPTSEHFLCISNFLMCCRTSKMCGHGGQHAFLQCLQRECVELCTEAFISNSLDVLFGGQKTKASWAWRVSIELRAQAHTNSHRPNIQALDEVSQVVASSALLHWNHLAKPARRRPLKCWAHFKLRAGCKKTIHTSFNMA